MVLTGVGTLNTGCPEGSKLRNPSKQNDAYKLLINTLNLVITTCPGVYMPYAVLGS